MARRKGDDEDDTVANKTMQEKGRNLYNTFEGKRSILRARSADRNYVFEDKVAFQTEIQITVASTGMVARDADQGIVHNKVTTTASSATPSDPKSTTPTTAYPLLGLVSPQNLPDLSNVSVSDSDKIEATMRLQCAMHVHILLTIALA